MTDANLMRSVELLLEEMSEITYGYLDKNHRRIYVIKEHEFYAGYRLQTPEEVARNRLGVCWDQVEYARSSFARFGCEFVSVYVSLKTGNSHTFLAFKLKDNYWYWFENSYAKYRGVHGPYLTVEAIAVEVIKHMREEPGVEKAKLDFVSLYDMPSRFGLTCQEFMDHCESGHRLNVPDALNPKKGTSMEQLTDAVFEQLDMAEERSILMWQLDRAIVMIDRFIDMSNTADAAYALCNRGTPLTAGEFRMLNAEGSMDALTGRTLKWSDDRAQELTQVCLEGLGDFIEAALTKLATMITWISNLILKIITFGLYKGGDPIKAQIEDVKAELASTEKAIKEGSVWGKDTKAAPRPPIYTGAAYTRIINLLNQQQSDLSVLQGYMKDCLDLCREAVEALAKRYEWIDVNKGSAPGDWAENYIVTYDDRLKKLFGKYEIAFPEVTVSQKARARADELSKLIAEVDGMRTDTSWFLPLQRVDAVRSYIRTCESKRTEYTSLLEKKSEDAYRRDSAALEKRVKNMQDNLHAIMKDQKAEVTSSFHRVHTRVIEYFKQLGMAVTSYSTYMTNQDKLYKQYLAMVRSDLKVLRHKE